MKVDFLNLGNKNLDNLIVVSSNDQISRDLGGEAVILNMKSGVYCGLNEVGARIWELLKEPKSVQSIMDTLLEEYEVVTDQCKSDLLALLQELSDNDLIYITNGNVA